MNSIDIKSLLIGALFTAVVFLSTGWQRSVVGGTQKVEVVKFADELRVEIAKWPSPSLKVMERQF